MGFLGIENQNFERFKEKKVNPAILGESLHVKLKYFQRQRKEF